MLLLHGTGGNQTGMPKDRGYFRLLRELANITLLYANEDPYNMVFSLFLFLIWEGLMANLRTILKNGRPCFCHLRKNHVLDDFIKNRSLLVGRNQAKERAQYGIMPMVIILSPIAWSQPAGYDTENSTMKRNLIGGVH